MIVNCSPSIYRHIAQPYCCHCQGQVQDAAYHPRCWEDDRLQPAIPQGPCNEQGRLWPTPPTLDTLFQPLPSGRRLRSIRTKTSHHKNSFFPSAAGLINKAQNSTFIKSICHFIVHCTMHISYSYISYFIYIFFTFYGIFYNYLELLYIFKGFYLDSYMFIVCTFLPQ